MPAKKQRKTEVTCPNCGHTQQEPVTAYSSVCKECHQHFRIEDLAQSPTPSRESAPRTRRVKCFNCATDLSVPLTAKSTMCKRCSSHVDLQDYTISNTVSKNFKTKGRFIIEPTGYLLNTDTTAGELILRGRCIGKIKAEVLTIYSSAQIRGSFSADHLLIPPGNLFHWPQITTVTSLEVGGEVVTEFCAAHTVILQPSARFFGDIKANNLIIESGAVFVGEVNIRTAPSKEP